MPGSSCGTTPTRTRRRMMPLLRVRPSPLLLRVRELRTVAPGETPLQRRTYRAMWMKEPLRIRRRRARIRTVTSLPPLRPQRSSVRRPWTLWPRAWCCRAMSNCRASLAPYPRLVAALGSRCSCPTDPIVSKELQLAKSAPHEEQPSRPKRIKASSSRRGGQVPLLYWFSCLSLTHQTVESA
jgi:hypothetical protein